MQTIFSRRISPSVKGYEEAMRRMGTTKETTLFIGDQLFTDVWAQKEAEPQYFGQTDPSQRGNPDHF